MPATVPLYPRIRCPIAFRPSDLKDFPMGSPFIAALAIRCGCDRIRSWLWISHIAKDATAFSELFQFIPYFPYSHYRKLNLGAG
jgi:hypothetical protein